MAFNSRGGSGWCSGVTWTHGTWRHAEVRFLLPGILVARMPPASARETERQQDGSEHRNRQMILAGLEPAILGSVGRCLIHWATGPDICVVHLMLQACDPNSPPQHESKSRGSDVTCFGPIALQLAARCLLPDACSDGGCCVQKEASHRFETQSLGSESRVLTVYSRGLLARVGCLLISSDGSAVAGEARRQSKAKQRVCSRARAGLARRVGRLLYTLSKGWKAT